ncbi:MULTISPECIES: hypothetical protein [unclassified Streptomyces]|uniref:hypothetical protein n=1 Tax=unclassified Streptomyces TaxID=2593676 RepID=UPI0006C117D3|nr:MULTISPECIES: hypothetical protein [unclassified Streptomyces]KOX21668.1 membrane protein [Streptomyces sp. NRRL F-6491]KOX42270.1 membrane protein [Streptomyces sp. NRRL F-6492]
MNDEEIIPEQGRTPPAAAPDASETPAGATPAARPRRRVLRTVGLIAVAAVLGLVGGTAVGYGVQAEREPTPLPPLNQPALAHPKPLPRGEGPEPFSAAEDRQVKAEGDLRKLLLPRPAGARPDGADGWWSLADYAGDFTRPGNALEHQLQLRMRRVAVRSWLSGEHRSVSVRLVQYRPSSMIGALEFVEDQQRIAMQEDESDSIGTEVKGSGNGRYFLYPVERKAGFLDFYQARAFVQKDDIAIEILVFDTRKIAEKDIRSLAERQLERL